MSTNKERGDKALSSLERELKARDRKEKTRPIMVVAASAVVILLAAGGIIWGASQGDDEEVTAQDETSAEETTAEEEQPTFEPLAMEREEALPATVTCTYEETGQDANGATVPNQEDVSAEGTVNVTLETNQGNIGMELDRTVAPCTVNAIEHLAAEGYYDDTVCHRLTTNASDAPGLSVLQCGDPTGVGSGGPGFQFANEYPTDEAEDTGSPVIYPRGSIAMANAGEDTNGSQFFLNYEDSALPPVYTYFGQIDDEGLSVLDSIAEAGVEGDAPDGAPAEEVTIETATVA